MKTALLFCVAILAGMFSSCNNSEEGLPDSSVIYSYNEKLESRSISILDSTIEIAYPFDEKELVTFPNGLTVEKLDSLYIFQGDVILTPSQVEQLSQSHETRSVATNSFVNYWPNHTVYYTYASGFSGQNKVQTAINQWQSKTGLDFVYGTGHGNYIEFKENTNDGNHSEIGMVGGKQTISLQRGSYNAGNIMHEIGHAVGLYHEHTRADRDNYVIVHTNNIASGKSHNFTKKSSSESVNFGTFDFGSIMLYGSTAFAKNSSVYTITRLDNSPFWVQRDSISILDASGVKAIYGPPYHKLKTIEIDSDYSSSGTSDQWSSTDANYIYFYSDKQCTQRTVLQYDRRMKIIQHRSVVTNGDSVDSYDVQEVVIPAGTYSYFIGYTQTNMHSDYGIDNGYDEYYYLAY